MRMSTLRQLGAIGGEGVGRSRYNPSLKRNVQGGAEPCVDRTLEEKTVPMGIVSDATSCLQTPWQSSSMPVAEPEVALLHARKPRPATPTLASQAVTAEVSEHRYYRGFTTMAAPDFRSGEVGGGSDRGCPEAGGHGGGAAWWPWTSTTAHGTPQQRGSTQAKELQLLNEKRELEELLAVLASFEADCPFHDMGNLPDPQRHLHAAGSSATTAAAGSRSTAHGPGKAYQPFGVGCGRAKRTCKTASGFKNVTGKVGAHLPVLRRDLHSLQAQVVQLTALLEAAG